MDKKEISPKDLRVLLIDSSSARAFIKKHHYSGKVVVNSTLHFGVFHDNKLHGVMQFGPPMVKRAMLPMIKGAEWADILELNRMAFTNVLPKNSESRCIAYAIRLIKKKRPNIKAIFSFADGCQCGDGTIYRACGFYLTNIKKNDGLRRNPADGTVLQSITAYHQGIRKEFNKWEALSGYQFRYIHTLGRGEDVLNVPIIPYAKIKELGISMYKGVKQ